LRQLNIRLKDTRCDRQDHLGPFLGLVRRELAEIGERARRVTAPRRASRALIGKAGIDLAIEPFDDPGGRPRRRIDAAKIKTL
jgi:hypothetical protein